MDWTPLILSIELATFTAVFLFVFSVPLASWLHGSNSHFVFFVEALVALPLVLPPSVLGFYLLVAFSPENAFGFFLEKYFSIQLLFTFPGMVLASMIYSLPFMVQPLLSAMRTLPNSIAEASYSLGKSKTYTLWCVILPNIKPALFSALILTFAHTLGEFGIVLMIGGNIPGETRFISLAIYDEVQAMHYDTANWHAGILLVFSLLVLVMVYGFNKKRKAF